MLSSNKANEISRLDSLVDSQKYCGFLSAIPKAKVVNKTANWPLFQFNLLNIGGSHRLSSGHLINEFLDILY